MPKLGLLDRIVKTKADEHAAFRESIVDVDQYRLEVETNIGSANRFKSALQQSKLAAIDLAVIAECKKASPSSGLIRENYNAVEIAKVYRSLGAAAISVLTDSTYFQGSIEDAESIASEGIITLRKDFILYEDQIYEAAKIGASAVLLIVRLLSDQQLKQLLQTATKLHLDVLVETHNETEVKRALNSGATILGINHRDLDTLNIDLSLTEKFAPMIRKFSSDTVIVAESGIENATYLERLKGVADAVLIGTYFMKAPTIEEAWHQLFQL